ncbi:MAG TPA: Uma2 family endonuclease [Blastocatellia bacterium]
MSKQLLEEAPALALDLNSLRLSDEQFEQLCRDNEDLRLELTADGELLIMAPTGGTTGSRNADLTTQLTIWAKKDGSGLSFDSSTMFCLSNGAKRSPDAAWIRFDRWNTLTEKEQESFVPLCPDFVVELRSPTDGLSFLQEKMQEYIANGALLGLLIDRKSRLVYLYRPDQPVEKLDDPAGVTCEPVLPEFVLSMKDIW